MQLLEENQNVIIHDGDVQLKTSHHPTLQVFLEKGIIDINNKDELSAEHRMEQDDKDADLLLRQGPVTGRLSHVQQSQL